MHIQLSMRNTWPFISSTKSVIYQHFLIPFLCLTVQAIDIIVEHLEKESNLYKRVDLFFLVDSITQCSRNQKGKCIVFPNLAFFLLQWYLFYRYKSCRWSWRCISLSYSGSSTSNTLCCCAPWKLSMGESKAMPQGKCL